MSLSARRTRRAVPCELCRTRAPRFFVSGCVRRDSDHRFCRRCYRGVVNRHRSSLFRHDVAARARGIA